jgi:DNA-binding transcriptional ArsR family regulator
MTTPSQIQKDLIKWRRAKVIELVSKGKNLSEIAEILKIDVSTVSRDYQYIRENASKVLEKYLVETVPLEMAKWTLIKADTLHNDLFDAFRLSLKYYLIVQQPR